MKTTKVQQFLPFPETLSQDVPDFLGRPAVDVPDYDRLGRDFYATPAWVTEALLRHVRFRGAIWEPCCGTGAMSTVLAAQGYEVVSTDIADRGFGEAGLDFLQCATMPKSCRAIVTNPPCGDAGSPFGQDKSSVAMLRFARHALSLAAAAQGQLALLVRLQWAAGLRAGSLAPQAPLSTLTAEARLAAVIVLSQRIRWSDRGANTNSAPHHHAWVVFDHAHPKDQPPAQFFA